MLLCERAISGIRVPDVYEILLQYFISSALKTTRKKATQEFAEKKELYHIVVLNTFPWSQMRILKCDTALTRR